MKPSFRKAGSPALHTFVFPALRRAAIPMVLLATTALAGCATTNPPPEISYDNAAPAVQTVDPPAPVTVVELPRPLPLPGQLQRVEPSRRAPEPTDPTARVNQANAAARIQPVRDGFINSMQVYPFTQGALYQVYAAPGQITNIALEPGEALTGAGPIAAGDTARWIIGDTESGSGTSRRVHILVKPTRPDIVTNLIITTDRRTYMIELRSRDDPYMPAVAWAYPQPPVTQRATPTTPRIPAASARHYRYGLQGDSPPWRPVSVFDDGRRVYIVFPAGIVQGEMPPLFVLGSDGEPEIVNSRIYRNIMIVDRIFAAAELRLGSADRQQTVRIVRTDGRPGS